MAGVTNASAKMLGKTNNKITNIKATFKALESFKPSSIRKKPVKSIPLKNDIEKVATETKKVSKEK